MQTSRLHRLAPAKVNLTLHLRGQRADGYHLLDSLVVFPRIGDRVTLAPAEELSLEISGPFAKALGAHAGTAAAETQGHAAPPHGEAERLSEAGSETARAENADPAGAAAGNAAGAGATSSGAAEAEAGAACRGAENLMLRAARALGRHHSRSPAIALHLEKNLPVASGIGGGSGDAAAVLALLARLWGVAVPDTLALALGADVPVCLRAPEAVRMQGIGDDLGPAPALPDFWLVLVNPGIALQTAAVFAGVADRNPPPPPGPPENGFRDFADLTAWLGTQRNDLEAPARHICPEIGDVLTALGSPGGAPLARMSGSGATCFALLPNRHAAEALVTRLKSAKPRWWVAAGEVSSSSDSG